MDELAWVADDNSDGMIGYVKLHAAVSDRKRFLFACACCRRIWPLISSARWREVVEVVELYADGLVRSVRVDEFRDLAGEASDEASRSAEAVADAIRSPALSMERASAYAYVAIIRQAAPMEPVYLSVWDETRRAESALHCALLRDIFGNPFRPVSVDHAWLTPDVITLAQAAYSHRVAPAETFDHARIGILADALEEAGCTNADILSHLRVPRSHVRGCWVVDLLTGRR